MKKNVLWIVALAIVSMCLTVTQAGIYSSELNSFLADSQIDDMLDVVILMTGKTIESQADITARLEELVNQGLVAEYHSVMMGHIFEVTATRTALDELVNRADVALISLPVKNTINQTDIPRVSDTKDGINLAFITVYGTPDNLGDYLVSSGFVASYTEYDIPNMAEAPSLDDLEPYDLIMLWVQTDMWTPSWGDEILYGCANRGQAIITYNFAHFFLDIADYMTYVCPFNYPGGSFLAGSLGDYDETSPIMEGVTSLGDTYGTIYDLTAKENAEVPAYWDNGYPIVAVSSDYPRVAAINCFPCDEMVDYGVITGDIYRLILNTAIYITDSGEEYYEYLPGDANMVGGGWKPSARSNDVTYLVNYFRGSGEACFLDEFYAAADANGSCLVQSSDVTFLVNYFRGGPELRYCSDYEPAWLSSDDAPEEAPDGWPNCDE